MFTMICEQIILLNQTFFLVNPLIQFIKLVWMIYKQVIVLNWIFSLNQLMQFRKNSLLYMICENVRKTCLKDLWTTHLF